MSSDKRLTPRVSTVQLPAKISVKKKGGSLIIVAAKILDVSRFGIRLYLQKPLPTKIEDLMEIETNLPSSGKPINIAATIVHGQSESEFGLLYIDVETREPIDELISECRILAAKHHKLRAVK